MSDLEEHNAEGYVFAEGLMSSFSIFTLLVLFDF